MLSEFFDIPIDNNKKPVKYLGIICSPLYVNRRKIQEFLYKIKSQADLTVYSGGNSKGGEPYVKKYSIEYEISYKEFHPAHEEPNLYSAMPDSYYSKPSHPSQYFFRYFLLMRYSDSILFFSDTVKEVKPLISMCKSIKIPYLIIK